MNRRTLLGSGLVTGLVVAAVKVVGVLEKQVVIEPPVIPEPILDKPPVTVFLINDDGWLIMWNGPLDQIPVGFKIVGGNPPDLMAHYIASELYVRSS